MPLSSQPKCSPAMWEDEFDDNPCSYDDCITMPTYRIYPPVHIDGQIFADYPFDITLIEDYANNARPLYHSIFKGEYSTDNLLVANWNSFKYHMIAPVVEKNC